MRSSVHPVVLEQWPGSGCCGGTAFHPAGMLAPRVLPFPAAQDAGWLLGTEQPQVLPDPAQMEEAARWQVWWSQGCWSGL